MVSCVRSRSTLTWWLLLALHCLNRDELTGSIGGDPCTKPSLAKDSWPGHHLDRQGGGCNQSRGVENKPLEFFWNGDRWGLMIPLAGGRAVGMAIRDKEYRDTSFRLICD